MTEHEARTQRMLDEAIAAELREHDTLVPPWRKYPGEHPYSIGWRMGAGEWYLMMYWKWAEGRPREEWIAYLRDYVPVPVEWADWTATLLDVADDDDPEVGGARLAQLGLVDLDAWRAYNANEA